MADFHVSATPTLVLNKDHRYRVSFWLNRMLCAT